MSHDTVDVAVVGGGISGLATAFWLRRAAPRLTVRVFEKETVPGGKLRTTHADGSVFDWGPNGFMAGAPDTAALVSALGLEDELRPAAPAAQRRYLYVGGRLEPLPSSPAAALGSRLLSPGGKARALVEALRRPARATGGANGETDRAEESVHAFLKRHFGSEAADLLGPALVTGVTAGDARRLSLDAAFPRLRALELQHGSLLRGMAAAGRAARASRRETGATPGVVERAAGGTTAGTAGRAAANGLSSFPGGVATLTNALAGTLSEALVTATEVVALEPATDGFRLHQASGPELSARQVVLATPAYAASAVLAPLAADVAEQLATIPYADVGVFGLTYPRAAVPHPLDGFGFLVAPGQGVRLLGVQFTSTLFPDQAPVDTVSLRVICGGTLDQGFLSLSDEQALASVRNDLLTTLRIEEEPGTVSYARWPRGIPQYHLGHAATVRRARQTLARWPGLYLAGNSYDGVAVNDCVRNARALATRLAAACSAAATSDSRPGMPVPAGTS